MKGFFEKPENQHQRPVKPTQEGSENPNIAKDFSYDDLTRDLNTIALENTGTYQVDERGQEMTQLVDDSRRIMSVPVVKVNLDLAKRVDGTKESIASTKKQLEDLMSSENTGDNEKNLIDGNLRRLKVLESALPRYESEYDTHLTENLSRLGPLLNKLSENDARIEHLRSELDKTYKDEKKQHYN